MRSLHLRSFLCHAISQPNVAFTPSVRVELFATVFGSQQFGSTSFSVGPEAVELLFCNASYALFSSRTMIPGVVFEASETFCLVTCHHAANNSSSVHPITARSFHFNCREKGWMDRTLFVSLINLSVGCEIFDCVSLNAVASCGPVCVTFHYIAPYRLRKLVISPDVNGRSKSRCQEQSYGPFSLEVGHRTNQNFAHFPRTPTAAFTKSILELFKLQSRKARDDEIANVRCYQSARGSNTFRGETPDCRIRLRLSPTHRRQEPVNREPPTSWRVSKSVHRSREFHQRHVNSTRDVPLRIQLLCLASRVHRPAGARTWHQPTPSLRC